jgi:prepilin-type N-terminal cleavage/methylation domain-containing protein
MGVIMYLRKFREECGFSLLEVIIAFAVLTIVVTGAISVLLSSMKLNEQTHLRSLARFGAMQKLDDIIMGIHPETGNQASISSMDGATFNVAGLTIKDPDPNKKVGSVSVTTTSTEYRIRVTITWTIPNTKTNTSLILETILPVSS